VRAEDKGGLWVTCWHDCPGRAVGCVQVKMLRLGRNVHAVYG